MNWIKELLVWKKPENIIMIIFSDNSINANRVNFFKFNLWEKIFNIMEGS